MRVKTSAFTAIVIATTALGFLASRPALANTPADADGVPTQPRASANPRERAHPKEGVSSSDASSGASSPAASHASSNATSDASSPAASDPSSGRFGFVSAYVLTKTGRPVQGARVRRLGATVARTDDEGAFFITLPVGPALQLDIEAEGFAPVAVRPVPVVSEATTEILIVLRSGNGTSDDIRGPNAETGAHPKANTDEGVDGERSTVDIEAPRSSTTARGRDPALAATSTSASTGSAVLRGRVLDEEKKHPVEGARILVRGLGADVRTKKDGSFELTVPAGPIELTVIHPDFSTESVPSFKVGPSTTRDLVIELAPQTVALAELVVTVPKLEGGAVFVLQERRESASVSDVLGADQISKTGDSDAAGALQRVTGVTVVGGRFIYVRGLGERYSSTLLNGSTLPSPDPERRVVPLDLFPASALGSILVQKTYSPDLPGEFGGGAVNLRTRDVPKTFEAKVEVSGAIQARTTFSMAPTHKGGSFDFLGFGAGARTLPEDFKKATLASRIQVKSITGAGFTPEELEHLGESLNLNYAVDSTRVPPNVGLDAEVGGPFTLFGLKAGAFAGLTYDQGWFVKRWNKKTLLPDLSIKTNQDLTETENTTNLGGLFSFTLDLAKNQTLRSTTFLSRISEKNSREASGMLRENNINSYRLQWIEQMMVAEQLQGHHALSDDDRAPAVDWRYMFSLATRDEPDLRDIFYVNDQGTLRLDTNDYKNQTYYGDLFDTNHDLGVDMTYPIVLFGDEASELKAGLAAVLKARDVDTRRFTFTGGLASPLDELPPGQIFNPDTIGPGEGQVEISEVTLDNDAYSAKETRFGGYIMGDIGLGTGVRLMAGARIETSNQKVETFLPPRDLATAPNATAELSTLDLLPAATFSWEFVDDVILRLALSRTVARPNFRELSPAVFRDPAGTIEFQGNPDLERTRLTNADVRVEWYPSPGEAVSVAGFWKAFEDPVEIRSIAGSVDREIPINVPGAHNLGGEIEFRKDFSFISTAWTDLYMAGNFTLISSQVSLDALDPELRGILTTLERPLQGQSPFVVNMQLGYDNADLGLSCAALYNVFGKRIASLGVRGLPDLYEEPVHRLDFVLRKRLGRFKLSLKAKNILDPKIERTQGQIVVERYRGGRSFSVGLAMDLD